MSKKASKVVKKISRNENKNNRGHVSNSNENALLVLFIQNLQANQKEEASNCSEKN